MKKNTFLSALLLLLSTCCLAQDDKEMIKQTFNNYKSAILNDKGEEAVNYVDSRTLKYYADILEVIKHADSSVINASSLIDKVTVLSVRHRATREEILSMDGTGLFVYAIKKGMVGKNSVMNNTIGDIKIDNGFAKGQLLVSGQPTEIYMHFYKEQDHWKIDLTSIFPIGNAAFKDMVEEDGRPENEFIFMILEYLTGKKPGLGIWQPLL